MLGCYVQYIFIKKQKVKHFLTGLFFYYILYDLVLWRFDSVKSLE